MSKDSLASVNGAIDNSRVLLLLKEAWNPNKRKKEREREATDSSTFVYIKWLTVYQE